MKFKPDKGQDLTLRVARLADVADLQRNCFPERPLEEVRGYLRWCLAQQERGWIVRLVAEVEGQVVANGQLTILDSEGEIGSLVVAPAHRRQGIGTALVQALVQEARKRRLCTVEITARSDVPWVRAWYQRLGFACHGERTFPGDEQVAVLRLSFAEPQP